MKTLITLAVKSSPEKNKISSEVANELLEVKDEQWMDTRATTAPITTDPELETVEVCRSKNS